MKIIGITGPTGAGKTTALTVLEELGVEIIDADAVYHRLLAENAEMKSALTDAFGTIILNEGGWVDRKALAGAVYPDRLEKLNAITHPFVVAEVDALTAQARQEGKRAVAIDAIALIESGLGERCGAIVAILAPLELRIRRIMARDGIDEDYARRRALAQKGEDFFLTHADYVLENKEEDTPEQFRDRTLDLFRAILEES